MCAQTNRHTLQLALCGGGGCIYIYIHIDHPDPHIPIQYIYGIYTSLNCGTTEASLLSLQCGLLLKICAAVIN